MTRQNCIQNNDASTMSHCMHACTHTLRGSETTASYHYLRTQRLYESPNLTFHPFIMIHQFVSTSTGADLISFLSSSISLHCKAEVWLSSFDFCTSDSYKLMPTDDKCYADYNTIGETNQLNKHVFNPSFIPVLTVQGAYTM
jgi:hypothetical protein